ncbi:hypothetical protein Tco_0169682 [Tanacetum coccineum]
MREELKDSTLLQIHCILCSTSNHLPSSKPSDSKPNILHRSQQSTRNRGKAIVTSSAPTYDPEPATVTEDEEMSKEKEIDKLMAFSLSQIGSTLYVHGTDSLVLPDSVDNLYQSLMMKQCHSYDRAQMTRDETDNLDQERDCLASFDSETKIEIVDNKPN